jgi:TolB-like protein
MNREATASRLRSWKAIASYLGCSVRTARRWESEEGLPVHRLMHKSQGSVYAYPAELDSWLHRDERGNETSQPPEKDERKSIAVLPFDFIGADSDSAYIADGFTDEVIADLSKIRTLRVTSRTSSMSLKGSQLPAKKIARSLGVGLLLEGSVQKQASSLRIAVRLVDPDSEDTLWANKYQGDLNEVFGIQERIARDVASQLELSLSGDDEARLESHDLDDVDAWLYAAQARQEAFRWRADALQRGISLFEKAVEHAGERPVLLASLGRAWLMCREAGVDLGPAPIEKAKDCAGRIAAVDPEAAVGLSLSGWIHYAEGDVRSAVTDLNAAIHADLNDVDSMNLLVNCYLISGRVSLARSLIDRVKLLDPLTPLARCLPGWADSLEGKFDNAVGPYREMFEMDPGNPMARLFLVWSLASAKRDDEAVAVAEGFSEETAGSVAGQVAGLIAKALKGESIEADGGLSMDAEALAFTSDIIPRILSQAYALLGETGLAIAWLGKAVERGFINYPYMAYHDRLWASIRDEPGFKVILRDVKQRWEQFDG